MNGSRKAHSKSRNGCSQCKRRRIRCDFRAPICSNCWKRDDNCDYQRLFLGSSVGSGSLAAAEALETPRHGLSATPLGRTRPSHLMLPQQVQNPSFEDSQTAELMRNFVERTALEFDLGVDGHRVWQREAIITSMHFPFLQHALIAVSGLHICHMRPSSRQSYYVAACRHSLRASELFRTSISSINVWNRQPILTFLIASMIFNLDAAFLSAGVRGDSGNITPAHLLRIMRTPGSLGRQVCTQLMSGPLAASLLQRSSRPRARADESVISAIESLAKFSQVKLRCNAAAALYSDAIESLRLWVEAVACQPRSWHDFLGWPVTIPVEYIDLLDRRDGFAIVIFIYWCAVMNRAPRRYYLTGAMKTMERLATVNLDPRWNFLLKWPRQELQQGR